MQTFSCPFYYSDHSLWYYFQYVLNKLEPVYIIVQKAWICNALHCTVNDYINSFICLIYELILTFCTVPL